MLGGTVGRAKDGTIVPCPGRGFDAELTETTLKVAGKFPNVVVSFEAANSVIWDG